MNLSVHNRPLLLGSYLLVSVSINKEEIQYLLTRHSAADWSHSRHHHHRLDGGLQGRGELHEDRAGDILQLAPHPDDPQSHISLWKRWVGVLVTLNLPPDSPD